MERFLIDLVIAAPPSRVWRALCDPVEVVQWDTGVMEALDAPPDYPRPGQYVRWRYRGGFVRILHDRPQEVVPERRLRSLLRVGPLRFDETYTLEPSDGGTRLTVTMEVIVSIPVIGRLVERWYALPVSRRAVAASMGALARHCERG
ncbi:MAG TPA: DUF2505 family protein [Dehalococcoidia bacterium]|nr:DUF2505 family protein [Dehalococcoidia bacterium]